MVWRAVSIWWRHALINQKGRVQMSYNRWSPSERLKWFFFENLGKLALGFIALLLAFQFPEQARAIAKSAAEAVKSGYDYLGSKAEFIFGVVVTIVLNYAKDAMKTSREVRSAGRALHEEIRTLRYMAETHRKTVERKYDNDDSYEQKVDKLGWKLKSGELSDWPEKLFRGTDYMPFFRANASKIAMLRVRWLLQGDDIVRLSNAVCRFISEYASIHQNVIDEAKKAQGALVENTNEHKVREIVRRYWDAQDKYLHQIKHFEENCAALVDVTRGF